MYFSFILQLLLGQIISLPAPLKTKQSEGLPGVLLHKGQWVRARDTLKKLQQLVTENPGKSISVFINPDDVTRPHFRIDDKFF